MGGRRSMEFEPRQIIGEQLRHRQKAGCRFRRRFMGRGDDQLFELSCRLACFNMSRQIDPDAPAISALRPVIDDESFLHRSAGRAGGVILRKLDLALAAFDGQTHTISFSSIQSWLLPWAIDFSFPSPHWTSRKILKQTHCPDDSDILLSCGCSGHHWRQGLPNGQRPIGRG